MTKMSGIYAQSDLPVQRYQDLAQKLYAPLLYGENSALLFFPLNGMQYDVSNMWLREEDRIRVLGGLRERFMFCNVSLVNPDTFGNRIWLEQLQHAAGSDSSDVGNFDAFSTHLKQLVREGKEPIFFVSIPSTLTDETLRLFFELATQVLFISPSRIHMLVTVEMRWNYRNFIDLTRDFHTLFQHTAIVPSASNTEVEHLVRHYVHEWKYPLSDRVIEYLVREAGGVFFCAKYGLRTIVQERATSLRDAQQLLKTHPYFRERVDSFLAKFTPEHRELMTTIANGKQVESSDEIDLLLHFDVIRRSGSGFELRSPFLASQFIRRDTKVDVRQIIDSADIFSKREKSLLHAILDADDKSMTRDQVSQILWGPQASDKYSEYVIDQTISRIRKKLINSSSLTHCTIVAKKKKGFTFITEL